MNPILRLFFPTAKIFTTNHARLRGEEIPSLILGMDYIGSLKTIYFYLIFYLI